jgi:hypothetical protein
MRVELLQYFIQRIRRPVRLVPAAGDGRRSRGAAVARVQRRPASFGRGGTAAGRACLKLRPRALRGLAEEAGDALVHA